MGTESNHAFATLRRFARNRVAEPPEHCDFCSQPLAAGHAHLMEFVNRKLSCVCDPCAVLFSGQHSSTYRRVPRRLRRLDDFCVTDARWEALALPINLAFFFYSTPGGRVIALYPSPAGPTESLLELSSWNELAAGNPALQEMEPDVEGLLVNRMKDSREYYLAPIDECFKLAGVIRTSWRGLSGGTEAWRKIGEFFEDLKRRSTGGDMHA